MGMFDRLLDARGDEWQTKAFDCVLETYRIGDAIYAAGCPSSYQVRILGGRSHEFIDSYATVRAGVLSAVPDDRDEQLPLVNYMGHITQDGA